MNLSFKGVEEDSSSIGQYIKTGINDITIREVYYQPVGPNVKEGGKPATSGVEKGVFVLVDKQENSFNYDVLSPKDADQAGKMMKRLIHFLSKTGKSSDIDAIKVKLQALPDMTFEQMIATFSKAFTGKQVRLKFVGSYPDRNYTSLPSYFNGWAECIDVNPTKLVYDESTEGQLKKDSNKVESTSKGESSTVNDELPW